MMIKKKRTWLVIADGAHARIFENNGPTDGLRAVVDAESEASRTPTREQGTGKPGRGFASGEARHAFSDPADWHEQAKDNFVRDISARINKAAEKDSFDQLVVAAPPKALGGFRDALGDKAKSRIVSEIVKDLTNVAPHDLPKHLDGIITIG